MTTDAPRSIGPDTYDQHYYGHVEPHTANYHNYGNPHWAQPLAGFLHFTFDGPFLDVGAAFGHLTRELNRLCDEHEDGNAAQFARAAEWSAYAYERRVCGDAMVHADGRALPWSAGTFGCVTSMDYLEHFPPDGTRDAITECDRVLRPGGYQVHLVGAHNPRDHLSVHMSDPTHQNHETLTWYLDAFQALGYAVEWDLTHALNTHAVWRETDWNGRWIVLSKRP